MNRCPSCLYGFDDRLLTDGEPTCPGCGRTALWYLREHSTHGADSDFEEVRLLDGTLVALLCTCGAQLPPVLHRDPDGWIVDASWVNP